MEELVTGAMAAQEESTVSRTIKVRERVFNDIRELSSGNRYHYTVLTRTSQVTESNRPLVVETFRSIAEILIWGDQNDNSVFE